MTYLSMTEQNPQCIVPAGAYYIKRDAGSVEGDYWGPREDPDGVLRDRNTAREERDYLDDIRGELTWIEYVKPKTVIDYGCGLGWFCMNMMQRGIICRGVDVSPHALEHCTKAGIPVSEYWPHGSSWDLIRSHHVIEHLENPVEWIKEARARGKYLIISTPDFGGPAARRFGLKYRMLHDPTHVSLFTNESMHRFLRDHGWHILDVQYPFPIRYASRLQQYTSVESGPFPGNWMTFYCQ